jgi:hypothetical protein
MISSGMESMVASGLKALGLDPEAIKAEVEAFMAHMREQVAAIHASQERLEAKVDASTHELGRLSHLVDELAGVRPSTVPILENGAATGTFMTTEKFPQELIDDVNRG